MALDKRIFVNEDLTESRLEAIKDYAQQITKNCNPIGKLVNLCAIKAISIKMVKKQKMLWKYFVNERNIMLSSGHSFIVKMVKSLRNSKYCFILMEFVN